MSSTGETKFSFRGGRTKMANFLMGTNANAKHLEEAIRQQILLPGEKLLGFFDGIFFDAEGHRVGGMALHDYLLVTDRHLTLWARDQFKDFVDHFPLSHCFVQVAEQKDMLHGKVTFGLVLPSVADTQLGEAKPVTVVFDFVPVADYRQLADLVEVCGSVHRDLIAGGAGEKDRWKATEMVFNQVFVAGKGLAATPPAAYSEAANDNDLADFGSYETGSDFATDDFAVTPLSRLDALDGLPAMPAQERRATPDPRLRSRPNPTLGAADSGSDSAAPLPETDDVPASAWLRAVRQAQNQENATPEGWPTPPQASLRKIPELQPDGLYSIGRAGRAAWDSLEKLRREGEARFENRSVNLLPFLSTMKDNGFNLRDITEFVSAVNSLMETVNQSPAARELLMNFINRSSLMSNIPGMPQAPKAANRPVPEVEEINWGATKPTTDNRKASKAAPPPVADPLNPPRYKVSIRKKSEGESEEGESSPEVALDEVEDKRIETFFDRPGAEMPETVPVEIKPGRIKVRNASIRLEDNIEN